ncbi:Retrovirus-related Pol polyprotein from transposon opus [Morus notabilis]|uniref:Retrovirus-related Pol polyprotein from transposon opus n=1 Tax=Morus notabilis TaxID=981085 RepID=W9QQX8_9ROSA|nr:Retrovirus-related Pol polyprotein from transposon opus [Morus notabilis]
MLPWIPVMLQGVLLKGGFEGCRSADVESTVCGLFLTGPSGITVKWNYLRLCRFVVDGLVLSKCCPLAILTAAKIPRKRIAKMEGRLGTRIIHISTNQTPFDQTETHLPDTEFYNVSKPFGTPLPPWNEIKDLDDNDLRNVLEKKRKKKEAQTRIKDYVDDLVVKSKAREGYWETLMKVFECCRKCNLKMNPKKCPFGVSGGKFLRFMVHQRGKDVNPTKTQKIATTDPPTTVKELKGFLRRLSYIRRFIPGLAALFLWCFFVNRCHRSTFYLVTVVDGENLTKALMKAFKSLFVGFKVGPA